MEKTGEKLSKGKTIKEKHQREIAGRENHRKGKSPEGKIGERKSGEKYVK